MPKLIGNIATEVTNATEITKDGYEPLTPGRYLATLTEVEARTSKAGNPLWNWEFSNLRTLDGDTIPGRQWLTTTIPTEGGMPATYTKGQESWDTMQRISSGRLKATFAAFGYSPDSDTDELIGEQVVLRIGIETIQYGDRKGERTNRVHEVLPATDQIKANANTGGGTHDDTDDDDLF